MDKLKLKKELFRVNDEYDINMENPFRNIVRKYPPKIFCKFGKKLRHDISRCWQLKNSENGKNNKKGFFTNEVIKSDSNIIEVPAFISKKRILVIFYTGASSNFISGNLTQSLDLKLQDSSKNFKTITREIKAVNKKTKFILKFETLKSVVFEIEAFVLDNLPAYLILGIDFMKSEDVTLSLKDNKLKIGEHELKIFPSIPGVHETLPDDIIPELVTEEKPSKNKNNTTVQENLNEETSDLAQDDTQKGIVQRIIDNNPPITEIKNTIHRIPIKENKVITSLAYKIPYNFYDATKAEIKRHLEKKIIKESSSIFVVPVFPLTNRMDQLG